MTAETHQPKFSDAEIVTKLFGLRIKRNKVHVSMLCTFDDAPNVFAVFHQEKACDRSLRIAVFDPTAQGTEELRSNIQGAKNYRRTRMTKYDERYKLHEFNFHTRQEFVDAAKKGQDSYSQDGKDDEIESRCHYNKDYILGELQRLMDIQPQ